MQFMRIWRVDTVDLEIVEIKIVEIEHIAAVHFNIQNIASLVISSLQNAVI